MHGKYGYMEVSDTTPRGEIYMKVIMPELNNMRIAANSQFDRLEWGKRTSFSAKEVASILEQCVDAITLDHGVFTPEMVGDFWKGLASNLRHNPTL